MGSHKGLPVLKLGTLIPPTSSLSAAPSAAAAQPYRAASIGYDWSSCYIPDSASRENGIDGDVEKRYTQFINPNHSSVMYRHLHHETQTKLKAHQDLASAISLQQYEQWYKENGIEPLLVERMRTKQLKEAVRGRRPRATSLTQTSKIRKKPRGSTSKLVKDEMEELSQSFATPSGLFVPDSNFDPDEYIGGADMMSLKGQVWPGMGKMDLANEDMRRTRNQRKPNSVIEKMRRTSEGIEPTQVVLTPKFEVERIKGVYDDTSSPSPDPEDPSPLRKQSKAKHKKYNGPLSERSVNISRSNPNRTITNRRDKPGKSKQLFNPVAKNENADTTTSFRLGRDIFHDDDSVAVLEDHAFESPSQRGLRINDGRFGRPSLNPISHSRLMSPSPISRDIPYRQYSSSDQRQRLQTRPSNTPGTHFSFGSFGPNELPYTLNNDSINPDSGRLPFNNTNHFYAGGHFPYRVPYHHQLHAKHEEYPVPADTEHLSSTTGPRFLGVSGHNPLFSQDHVLTPAYSHETPGQSLSSLNFAPVNRDHDNILDANEPSIQHSANHIKLEAQFSEIMDANNKKNADVKDASFNPNVLWDSHLQEQDLDVSHGLHTDELEL